MGPLLPRDWEAYIKGRVVSCAAAILLAAVLGTGCDDDRDKKEKDKNILSLAALFMAPGGDFTLANSRTASSSRLDILYGKTFSGNVSYIVSKNDLHITSRAQFDASTETKVAKAITADDQNYDDYIAITSLSSNTKYHVYILNSDTGTLTTLTGTTKAAATSVQETGTFSGYGGPINYSINFPAGYSAASFFVWPLVLSVKAPNFTSNDPNFPCITFNTNINWNSSTQMDYDVEELRKTFNAVIENPSYKIDKSRIYGCGFSAGGGAVMKIANDDGSSQYKMVALVLNGISGWVGDNQDWVGNLHETNMWISCGVNDPYGADDAYAELLKDRISGDLLLSVYPDLGHDSSPTWASPYTFMWLLSK